MSRGETREATPPNTRLPPGGEDFEVLTIYVTRSDSVGLRNTRSQDIMVDPKMMSSLNMVKLSATI